MKPQISQPRGCHPALALSAIASPAGSPCEVATPRVSPWAAACNGVRKGHDARTAKRGELEQTTAMDSPNVEYAA